WTHHIYKRTRRLRTRQPGSRNARMAHHPHRLRLPRRAAQDHHYHTHRPQLSEPSTRSTMTSKTTDLVPVARSTVPGCAVCTAFTEPSDVEFLEHWVRGASSDLVRQKLTGDQAERCTAVSECEAETVYVVDAAENGFPVTGNRLPAAATPGRL